jgi:hypothetical protein
MLYRVLIALLLSFFLSMLALAQVTSKDAAISICSTAYLDKQQLVSDTVIQHACKGLQINGSVDVYYRYDFNQAKANNLTSYTNSFNSFSLGMASVKLQHHSDNIKAVLDFGFGARAKESFSNDEGLLQSIKQLYINYTFNKWLQLTAGTWATHVGYELVDPQLNRNYSTSYLFTKGPFTHTGIKADVVKDKHTFMIGMSNATDYRIPKEGQINKKFLIAQYTYTPNDRVKIYLNYLRGQLPDSSKNAQLDVVITAIICKKISLAGNITVSNNRILEVGKYSRIKNWGGAAFYCNIDPKPWLGFTFRSEYFNDHHQLKVFNTSPTGSVIFANTLSAILKVKALMIIPEWRVDKASEPIFTTKYGVPRLSATSFLVAAVYGF